MNFIRGIISYKKPESVAAIVPPKLPDGKTNPAYTQLRRQRARAKGRCGQCAKRRVKPGLKYCANCLDRALQRKLRAEAEGICTRCIKNPAKPGRKYCQVCCDREKIRWIKADPELRDKKA